MGTEERFEPCGPENRAKPWCLNLSTEMGRAAAVAAAFDRKLDRTKVDVLAGVIEERQHQDDKHGSISTNGHTIGEWILIMEAELHEAKVALIKGGAGRDSVLSEILQVTAVGFACLEQHGIREIKERSV